MYSVIVILILLASVENTYVFPSEMVEICDNGIDDDGDGAIDLWDTDCECPEPEPVSLIPNPSYEEMNCCPGNRSQMGCADSWIQASSPTTDYIHTCGWMGWEGMPVPLPLPDGEGCVGFRDGRPGFSGTNYQSDWKEYTGACLLQPLKSGETYKFQFYVGFTNRENSPPFNVTFFGTSNCNNLPFGPPEMSFGCPLNYSGWVELGRTTSVGVNQWRLEEIIATPTIDISAIVIGPSCQNQEADNDLYYFFDNLILAERSEFGTEIILEPNSCVGNATMSVPAFDSLTYQWYKDGIALVGETQSVLTGDLKEGDYQVRMISPGGCSTTNAKPFRSIIDVTFDQVRICPGEIFIWNQNEYTEPGFYRDTLSTSMGCDSIVDIHLIIDEDLSDTLTVQVFSGESYQVGASRFTDPGNYDIPFTSDIGCDSTVHLILSELQIYLPNIFSPNEDGQNDTWTYNSNEEVQVISLHIFDRWGSGVMNKIFVDNDKVLWDGNAEGQPAVSGVYTYAIKIILDNGAEKLLNGSITIIR